MSSDRIAGRIDSRQSTGSSTVAVETKIEPFSALIPSSTSASRRRTDVIARFVYAIPKGSVAATTPSATVGRNRTGDPP
ncbi:hypothetical protein ACFQL0_07510 [Haloplanus litoreus]|uniref:hypothetical protein n=1 Tax=Haloplanus litoreus TaxID=767515 RepID=UPI00360B572E